MKAVFLFSRYSAEQANELEKLADQLANYYQTDGVFADI